MIFLEICTTRGVQNIEFHEYFATLVDSLL